LDALHSILFYVFAAIAWGGGLAGALLRPRSWRGIALAVLAVGVAGLLADLSASFAAGVAAVSLLACAVLCGSPLPRARVDAQATRLTTQLGGIAAALLLAVLVYAILRSSFNSGSYPGGEVGTAALGRLLFGHDALAVEAAGAMLLAAMAGAAAAWRVRGR
jgi:NADH:ubiquinone oxidoreductase subunit 6 (subunit J)